MKQKHTNTLATMKKVLRYLKHYRLLFALSLLLAIAVVGLTLYLPILTGDAIDLIIAPGQVDFEALSPLLLIWTSGLWATRSAASSLMPTSSPTACSWASPSSSRGF